MRLDEMTPALVRRAVEIYLRHAYPPGVPARPPLTAAHLFGPSTMAEMLERLHRERDIKVENMPRYTLQLGNHRYPFMKFVLQEYLVDREYFFDVDTHDKLAVQEAAPDYREWLELKGFNRQLGAEIERDWRAAGLPTLDDLRTLCEQIAPVERESSKGARILLVDDDVTVACGLRALLLARGYDCELAHSGEGTLERLALDPLPDLVVLDYELPGLDGQAVLARLRGAPRTARLRILMATASRIDLAHLPQVDAVLHKPYPRELFFRWVRQLVPPPGAAPSGGAPPRD